METATKTNDIFDGPPKALPGMLNTLTILTLIGCGLGYLGSLFSFYKSLHYDEELAKIQDAQDKVAGNEMASKMVQDSMDIMQRTHEYRYVLLLSGLLFTTLCLIGALQMRKLKKSGYTIYVIGEIVPLVLTAALIGFSLTSGIMMILSALVAVIFVILYTTQRKYLVNQ